MWLKISLCVVFVACSASQQPIASTEARATAEGAGSMAPIAPSVVDAGASHAVRIDLAPRKSTYFLGENVLVDFCVVNGTDAPVKIEVGGDYRGGSRSARFKVEVRDASGNVMADPDPDEMNFGGLGYSPDIAPGERFCQSLPLMRYARIDSAGTYTISATHDLGWPAGTAPQGKTTVAFAMPNASQAEAAASAMEALPVDLNNSSGKISALYRDFSTMRYDVYVAPLASRARAGKAYAIEGLSEIPTANATRALVALLGHASKDIAHAAAMALAMRLPDPAWSGQLGARNPFENSMTPQRKYLSSHAWDSSLADDVRTAARARLASNDESDQRDGAFMLEAVGTSTDAPSLVKALDLAIDRTRATPAETNVYPVPRGACQELLRAAEMLVARGYAPPAIANASTPGEIALRLVALSHVQLMPAGGEREIASAMKHSIAYIRQLALVHVPANHLTPALVALVSSSLVSSDPDVVVAAAELAQREKVTSLAPNVVAAMKAQRGLRLDIVSNAAHTLGARFSRAKVLVALLAEKSAFDEALSELVAMLDAPGRSTDGEITEAQRASVAAQWKTFVEAHRAEIEADKKFALDDPSVKPALVPTNWKLTRKDGTSWP